ncbi:MAG: hypothetical protein K2Y28_05935 [Burkholderiaceae bacterium]|nr:hypothetical protein [Burkholderiaceae bacterium]
MTTQNSSKIGSHFSLEIQEALHKKMEETPCGCGGCAHAEWINGDRKFVVGVCRLGIKLEHEQLSGADEKSWSLAGYTPALYCTAQNSEI